MNTSELVTATHLERKAIIFIRKSTPHQVLSNQESLRLQYNLKQKAVALGWRPQDIEIIDSDLGMTATSAEHRHGFQSLVAKVSLGQVGIILSSEVTRLSRNCSDWYPLLDVCGYKECLIADGDGLYDPGSLNPFYAKRLVQYPFSDPSPCRPASIPLMSISNNCQPRP